LRMTTSSRMTEEAIESLKKMRNMIIHYIFHLKLENKT
jgi:hypothetical protein